MSEILSNHYIVMICRLIFSCMCGIAIGFERKSRAKEAGIRTHCIVACASALMMLISKYGFSDMLTLTGAEVKLDPSRMAQGIVTGVGFLGSGIIYAQRSNIRGLTTAAGLWATAGIGMAIGAGMYFIGACATLLILLTQLTLHSNNRFLTSHKNKILKIYAVNDSDFQHKATEILKEKQVVVREVAIAKHSDGSSDYTFYCEMAGSVNEEMLINLFEYKCTIDITR